MLNAEEVWHSVLRGIYDGDVPYLVEPTARAAVDPCSGIRTAGNANPAPYMTDPPAYCCSPELDPRPEVAQVFG